MSVKHIKWAIERVELGAHPRLILIALADWASDEGVASPSTNTIASRLGMSEDMVERFLGHLESRGYLTRVEMGVRSWFQLTVRA